MSFHLTGQDIRVEDNHILIASLQNEEGDYIESSIDLNQFIGNDNGNFQWDGENFSDTAQNVHFAIEGGADVPVLRGELRDLEGNWDSRDLNLAERVVNNNGQFEFQ
ncbi:CVNH domain-containing protein [Aspergillus ruber CBS 135680]|uniref:Cyanovirin-N n=1 Tax=Aspergillus ruber (strain CBS 135680) TaxID=1388766 RepID=A0A017SAM0_ASPRC|nr:Cyanovirin-N [Aspergillus ruber CBS 135680]EYE93684.1 Cyanovirin-N [Aspergillus ruber CBS 135680]